MEVVYADGTFDLLHPGHIDFLTRIKPDNSKLIVGVISDSNVKTYKRIPFLSSKDRALMLSEMKIVDQVVYDCPFGGIPAEFIKEHGITRVVYAGEDGTWKDHYKVPIEMGIMSYVEYNKSSISTTKIIEKVKGEADQLSWWGEVTSNNKDEVIAKNLKLKDDRLALFKIIKDILDSNNIEYWIDQGTLLGAYRNGQIIPIDNDCDFAICKMEDYKRVKLLLDNNLGENYYYLQDTEYAKKYEIRKKDSEMLEIKNSEWALVACDICMYTLDPETDMYKQEYYQFGIDKTRIPKDYLFPLKEIDFEGHTCPCPNKTKGYLEEYYGYIGEDAVLDPKTSKYKKRCR
jgi:glycerol-3-phosphate cytidylyltransferase